MSSYISREAQPFSADAIQFEASITSEGRFQSVAYCKPDSEAIPGPIMA